MTASVQANIPDGQEIFNRVFIGGLSRETSELELETFFSSFGEVVDVRIVCDRKTGLNKGYGFVTFATTIARNELLKKGTVDYKNGRKLRLRKAVKKELSSQFLAGESSSQNGAVMAQQIVLVPVTNEFSTYQTPVSIPPPTYYQVPTAQTCLPAVCVQTTQPSYTTCVPSYNTCVYYY
ncbi:unnamed protein product [Porites evermanni]|uniref:RRM domain-containing protein n=1 Tax=Porites evermanni TaxID=104178 RepID=A0ABN8SFA4_9CNID|nr:unnamed protein product [Porites evermanni]